MYSRARRATRSTVNSDLRKLLFTVALVLLTNSVFSSVLIVETQRHTISEARDEDSILQALNGSSKAEDRKRAQSSNSNVSSIRFEEETRTDNDSLEASVSPVERRVVSVAKDLLETKEENVRANETTINANVDVLMQTLQQETDGDAKYKKSFTCTNCASIKVKWTDITSRDPKWMKITSNAIDNNLALKALNRDVNRATTATTLATLAKLTEEERTELVNISNEYNSTNSSLDSNQYSKEFIDERKLNKVVTRTSFATFAADATSKANSSSSTSTFFASSVTQAIDKNAHRFQDLMIKTANDTLSSEQSVHVTQLQRKGDQSTKPEKTKQNVNKSIKAETLKLEQPSVRRSIATILQRSTVSHEFQENATTPTTQQTIKSDLNSAQREQNANSGQLTATPVSSESNLTTNKHNEEQQRTPPTTTSAEAVVVFPVNSADSSHIVTTAHTTALFSHPSDVETKSTTKINSVATVEKQKKKEEIESAKDIVNSDWGDEDDRDSVLPHLRCSPEHLIDVQWNLTEAGVLALRPCPFPYTGSVYRPCYSSGSWGRPDYTECRLPHLREIQNLIFYHVHKHLVDGLYPLAEELSRLVTSEQYAIKSPMDRLDAFDALNAILRAKIKIRMEDEIRDRTLIQSLTSTADQLLTGTQVSFAVEAEKNALITMKSAETIFGIRLLSENILRALIVFCNDGTINRIKSINPNTKNIKIFLKHRTSFGTLMPLLEANNSDDNKEDAQQAPQANVHLEDFQKLGVGLTLVWIRGLGSELNSQYYDLVSDLVLVSIVPAVSIEVDFEETPQIEIWFKVNKMFTRNAVIKCGRIKTPRELWTKNDCRVIRRNVTDVGCLCREMGAIGVLQQKSFENQFERIRSSCHLNTFVIYVSASFGVMFLLAVMVGQLIAMRHESREMSFILINLLFALSSIQVIFLLGGPFHTSISHHNHKQQQICKFVALLLHYIHLASGFWMLSHTIYLYQRLWRPISYYSSCSPLPFTDSDCPSSSSSCSLCSSCCTGYSRWGVKRFAVLSWIVPGLIVVSSYFLNSVGYEYRRYCWMSIEGGMMFSFIVPVSLLIMTNTVVMLLVLKRFFAHKPIIHKIEIERTQPSLRAGVTLLPFFAVNWFLSVLALEDTATTIFQYIFAIVNAVQCFLVFLFHLYQRHDVTHRLKSKFFAGHKRQQKSILKLKKSHSCRGLRADIPRLYLGAEPLSNAANYSGTSEQERNCSASDSQPLLMPYSSSGLPVFDPSVPSTSKQGAL